MNYFYRFFSTGSDSTSPSNPEIKAPIVTSSNIESDTVNRLDPSKINNLIKPNIEDIDVRGNINRNKCFKIIEKVKNKKGFENQETALAMITGLVQNGGSNKAAGNTIFERNGLSLSSNELHACIKEVEKKWNYKTICKNHG